MLNITNIKLDDALLVAIIVLLIFLLVHKHWFNRSSNTNPSQEIGIKNLVEKVRSELKQAEEERQKANESALFKVDKFDLEINYVVKIDSTATAGIKLEPITVGGQTETSSEKVQKITLHLIPAASTEYEESSKGQKPISSEEIRDYDAKPPSTKGDKQ